VRLIKMQYLQAVPTRITRPLLRPLILFFPFRSYPPWTARSIFTSIAPTANGEIMIKPTSFQWNDGNYCVGCSRLPVFVHYSEAVYKYLARKVEGGRRKVRSQRPNRAHSPTRSTIHNCLYSQFSRGRGNNVNIAYK